MTNPELAAWCLARADAAMHTRKVALCVYVALSTTTSLAGARRALEDWSGPAQIRTAALDLLGALAAGETP